MRHWQQFPRLKLFLQKHQLDLTRRAPSQARRLLNLSRVDHPGPKMPSRLGLTEVFGQSVSVDLK